MSSSSSTRDTRKLFSSGCEHDRGVETAESGEQVAKNKGETANFVHTVKRGRCTQREIINCDN